MKWLKLYTKNTQRGRRQGGVFPYPKKKTHISCLIIQRIRRWLPLLALDKGNIGLGPVVDLLLGLGVSRSRGDEGAAGGDRAKVDAVGARVEAAGAGVAVDVVVALADLDLVDGVVIARGLGAGEPVLGGGVAVVEQDGGQARDRVVEVGDAVLGAGLGGDEVGDDTVAETGGAVGVDVDGVASGTEVGSTNGGDGTTKRVAGSNDLEARVGVDGSSDAVRHLLPGTVEALVELTSRHEARAGKGKVDIGDPVQDVAAASDSKDDLATGVIDGNVASNAGPETVKGADHGDAVGLNLGAVAATGDGAAGSSLRVAVGRASVLHVEGEVVDLRSADLSLRQMEHLGVVLDGHGHGRRQGGGGEEGEGAHVEGIEASKTTRTRGNTSRLGENRPLDQV